MRESWDVSEPPTYDEYETSAMCLRYGSGSDTLLQKLQTFGHDRFLQAARDLAGTSESYDSLANVLINRKEIRPEAFMSGAILGILLCEEAHTSLTDLGISLPDVIIGAVYKKGFLPGGDEYVQDDHERAKLVIETSDMGLKTIGDSAVEMLDGILERIEKDKAAQSAMKRAMGFVAYFGHEIHIEMHRACAVGDQERAMAQELQELSRGIKTGLFDEAMRDWLDKS